MTKHTLDLIKNTIKRATFATAASGLCLGVLFVNHYAKVNIIYDNQTISGITFIEDEKDILRLKGIEITDDDLVYSHKTGRDIELRVYKAYKVTFHDGNNEVTEVMAAGTINDALQKADLQLGDKDIVKADLSRIITADTTVEIQRNCKILLKADGKRIYTNRKGITVSELLKENGIELGKNDTVNYKLNKKVKDGMKIVVQRIKYETVTKTEKIKFKTEKKKDSTLNKGEKSVIKKGVNGEKKVSYLIKYIDGEVDTKVKLREKTIKKPKKQVVAIGAKEQINNVVTSPDNDYTTTRPGYTPANTYTTGSAVINTSGTISELTPDISISLDANGRPVNYKEKLIGEATAYSSGTVCSTGVKAVPGRVAVDPKEIPYGTKMYIVSCDGKYNYGYAVAADTGGFIYTSDTMVDLRFNSEDACRQFGRRNIEIYILEYGDGTKASVRNMS